MVEVAEKAADITEEEMDEIAEDSDFSICDEHCDPLLEIYMRELARYPLLNAEDEKRLFAELEEAKELGDQRKTERIREKIVLANLRLVVSVAKKYRNADILSFSDLIQEGNAGLMTVIDKFDYRKGNKFSTYAVWWIRQSIQRAIANSVGTIRVPVHIQSAARTLRQAAAELHRKGKKVSKGKLSEETDISPERIERILAAQKLEQLYSLNCVLPSDEGDTSELGDLIPDEVSSPEDEVAQNDLREQIEKALSEFTKRDADILRMRYGLTDGTEYTLQQIADKFRISRERVRQLQNSALARLKHPQKRRKLASFMN